MLTEPELQALDLTRELANLMAEIVGDGASREQDIAEAVWYIHGIQRMVMSQSAAREYPDRLRQLGEVIGQERRAEHSKPTAEAALRLASESGP